MDSMGILMESMGIPMEAMGIPMESMGILMESMGIHKENMGIPMDSIRMCTGVCPDISVHHGDLPHTLGSLPMYGEVFPYIGKSPRIGGSLPIQWRVFSAAAILFKSLEGLHRMARSMCWKDSLKSVINMP